MTTFYCRFNCGKGYVNEGKAKSNHEDKCRLEPENSATLPYQTHFDCLDSLDSINRKRGRLSNTESVLSIIKKAKVDKEVDKNTLFYL